jgi:hypothetical protein
MPGFLALLRVDRDTGDAVVAATNATTGLSSTFAPDLLTAFVDAEPHPPAAWHPSEVTAEILDLVGPWYWGPMPMVLRALPDGWLSLGPAGDTGRTSRFRPGGNATWVGLDGYYAGEPLRVVRHPDGSVSHLDLASFCFTRTPYDPAADIPGGVDPQGWR